MSEGAWPIVSLGELIASIEAGASFRCRETPPEADEVGVAKVSAVSWGSYDEMESKTCLNASRIDPNLLIQKGDFLISRANTVQLVGACVIAERVTKQVMLSDKTLRIQFKDPSLKPWVLHYLRSREGRNQIEALCTGNQESMRNISQKSIRQIQLPLAPAEERDRVIAYLDQQLSRLQASVVIFSIIQAKLKQARASILKAAVEGRLVETETELAIRQGRTHELAAELLDTMDRQKNKKSAITSETAAPQWDAPTSWEWTNIGHVSLKVKYGTSAKCQERGDGIPVIRMGNIQDGKIHMDKIKYLPKTHYEFPEQLLRKGEVLFNRTNSIDLVGKTAVFRGDSPHACASYIIRVLPADGISPEFLAITLNSPFGRAWARHEASQQVGQANINSKKLMNFRFPLPPRLEQLRIKEEVDRRFSVLDQVEATVQTSLARCGKLQQVILKRAFGA